MIYMVACNDNASESDDFADEFKGDEDLDAEEMQRHHTPGKSRFGESDEKHKDAFKGFQFGSTE